LERLVELLEQLAVELERLAELLELVEQQELAGLEQMAVQGPPACRGSSDA
jgi:hypothetical protein